jgi:hypothetical protein
MSDFAIELLQISDHTNDNSTLLVKIPFTWRVFGMMIHNVKTSLSHASSTNYLLSPNPRLGNLLCTANLRIELANPYHDVFFGSGSNLYVSFQHKYRYEVINPNSASHDVDLAVAPAYYNRKLVTVLINFVRCGALVLYSGKTI